MHATIEDPAMISSNRLLCFIFKHNSFCCWTQLITRHDLNFKGKNVLDKTQRNTNFNVPIAHHFGSNHTSSTQHISHLLWNN